MISLKEVLENNVIGLSKETATSMELREAIETLTKIVRNVVIDKPDSKHLQIKVSNSRFHKSVWKYDSARQLLLKSGWVQEDWSAADGSVIQLADKEKAKVLLEVLIASRNVKPLEGEWNNSNKYELIQAEKERLALEEKQKSVDEGRKLYLQMQQDKASRKELAERIMIEAKADREYRNIRQPKSDAQIKREEFNSLKTSRSVGVFAGPSPILPTAECENPSETLEAEHDTETEVEEETLDRLKDVDID
ncbi:hypothetical protein HDE_03917 [Halotydeus destructor]|nr:hypothetical protein HDE_03917 [Halotydeus destructor]